MVHRLEERAAGGVEHVAERGLRRNADAHRHGVDEEPHGPGQPPAVPQRPRGRDHDVPQRPVAPGEQGAEHGGQHDVRRGATATRVRPHGRGEVLGDRGAVVVHLEGAPVRTRPVRRRIELRLPAQFRSPEVPRLLVVLAAKLLVEPPAELEVARGRGPQGVGQVLVRCPGPVQGRELVQQHVDGRAVDADVVHQQGEQVLGRPDAGQVRTDERRPFQADRARALAGQHGEPGLRRVRRAGQVGERQLHRPLVEDLHGPLVTRGEAGPEGLVPLDQCRQGGMDAGPVEVPGQPQRDGDHEERQVRVQLREQPQPGLQSGRGMPDVARLSRHVVVLPEPGYTPDSAGSIRRNPPGSIRLCRVSGEH